MIELNVIQKQVRRLGALHFPPATAEGWQELSKILQRRCANAEHVERVIDRWIETEDDCPTPSQLGSCAGKVPADPGLDNPVLNDPCPQCEPYNGAWKLVSRLLRNGETVEGTSRCDCARGRQLAALDAQRAKTEAANERKGPGRILPVKEDLSEDAS